MNVINKVKNAFLKLFAPDVLYAESNYRTYPLVPRIGSEVELRDGTIVNVICYDTEGKDLEEPQFVGEDSNGERRVHSIREIHIVNTLYKKRN